MKRTKSILTAIALGTLSLAPAMAEDAAPEIGALLEGINMFTPEEGDPAYKVRANEKYGTQWAVDMAYGMWGNDGAAPSVPSLSHYALIHAQLNQRLIQDDTNGGTWLRVEFSGAWGIGTKSASSSHQLIDGFGEWTGVHADMLGPHEGILPEVAVMQYFAGKRACLIAGVVNLTNYFDAVSIANDSFSGFTNGAFINSTVLGLPDSNLGAILQVEINRNNYAMIGFSREVVAEFGDNPFNSNGAGSSYMVVGEWGHIFADGAATLRLNPFYRQCEGWDGDIERNFGLAGSIEYTVNDGLTVYARTGVAHKQEMGAAFDFSCGANYKLIPSREDDFLGVAYGVFKPAAPAVNNREQVIELMYSCQVTDNFKILPHVQFIANPAYNPAEDNVTLFGVQGVYSF